MDMGLDKENIGPGVNLNVNGALTSVGAGLKPMGKVVEVQKICSTFDWVQIKAVCTNFKSLKRIFVVDAGMTLYNIHRVFLFSGKHRGDLGLDHTFVVKGYTYTSGADKQIRDGYNDRKVRLFQVLSGSQEDFQYFYGSLKFEVSVQAVKKGDKVKLDWLPRVCTGSKGSYPPEPAMFDVNFLQNFKPKREINIDKINKTLMHERFGANQKTNIKTKRDGPSILCQKSHAPHSTIAAIYRRAIEAEYSESSEISDWSEIVV